VPPSVESTVTDSVLTAIFGKETAWQSVKQSKSVLIKAAHLIIPDREAEDVC